MDFRQLTRKIRSVKDIYLFDVDGTLTPSRKKIDKEFSKWFSKWTLKKTDEVYLVTGSDNQKTVEQIGEHLLFSVDAVFNCSGNSIWHQGKELFKCDWIPSEELEFFLDELMQKSNFKLRTGIHLERRTGMLNFSVLGRGATFAQRLKYIEYDTEQGERSYLAHQIKEKFPELEVQIAGETGIDIFPAGRDKSQVLDYFLPSNELATIHFFGDKMSEGGNDKPLADAIIDHWQGDYKIHTVKNWTETFNVLKTTVI